MGSSLNLKKSSPINPNKDGYPTLSKSIWNSSLVTVVFMCEEMDLLFGCSRALHFCHEPSPRRAHQQHFACGGFLRRCNCRRAELDMILILVPAEERRLWRDCSRTTFLGRAFWRRLGETKKGTEGMQRYDLLLPRSSLHFLSAS